MRTIFFFFNDTATTEIYTLSLHDALPISVGEELLSAKSHALFQLWLQRVGTRHERFRNGAKAIQLREIGRAPSELQSQSNLVCRLLLEKKTKIPATAATE